MHHSAKARLDRLCHSGCIHKPLHQAQAFVGKRCNENTKENTLTHTEGSQVLTRSTTPTSVHLCSGHLRQGRGLTRNARKGGLQQRRASSSKASRLDSHPSNIMSTHEEPRVRNWLHQSNRNCRARHGATGVKRDMPTRARTPEGNEQEAQKAPSSFVTDDPSSFPFVSRVRLFSFLFVAQSNLLS